MDEENILRFCRANLRLLFAVDPDVGESFAAANADLIGNAIQMPPKPLHLKLHTSEERLGEIDLMNFASEQPRPSVSRPITDMLTSLLATLSRSQSVSLQDGYGFLTDAEHRRAATAPARQLAREGVATIVAAAGNQADAKIGMENIYAAARWAETAHADMKITGRAASWYLGYAAILTEASDLTPSDFEAQITPLLKKGGARQTTMLAHIAAVLCHSNAGDRVAHAADSCLGKGMRLMGEAYQAKDLEQFQTRIYGALPNLLAAYLLAGITNSASPAHARSSRSAELAILRALHTLQNAIADQQGLAMLRTYQAAIAAIRAREGAGEAKRMTLELTDMMMLYPAICKPILSGDVRL